MTFSLTHFAATLITDTADAVVYADAQGIIQFWNGGAARIFGFSAADAVGQKLDIIIPDRLRERHWTGFHHTMETGQSRYAAGDLMQVPAIRKNGTRLSIAFTIVPFRDDQGKMEGIAAIMRDVTQQFDELRALRQQAAAAKP